MGYIVNKTNGQKLEVDNNQLSLLLKYNLLKEENGLFFFDNDNKNKISLIIKADLADKVNMVYALKEFIEEIHDESAKDFLESNNIKVNHNFLKIRRLRKLYQTLVNEGFEKENK